MASVDSEDGTVFLTLTTKEFGILEYLRHHCIAGICSERDGIDREFKEAWGELTYLWMERASSFRRFCEDYLCGDEDDARTVIDSGKFIKEWEARTP